MRPDDIMQLQAGREMDALVAELVMGESKPSLDGITIDDVFRHNTYSPGGAWYITAQFENGDIPYWDPVRYSTDIADAWKIIEKLRAEGKGIQVMTVSDWDVDDSPIIWQCFISATSRIFSRPQMGDAWANANTAPLAICRAALIAERDGRR